MEEFRKGLVSGIVSSIICSPLDLIRTRWQLGGKETNFTMKIYGRSLVGSLSSQPPFWALYFSIKKITNDIEIPLKNWIQPTIASVLTNPLFLFRTRIQSLDYVSFGITKLAINTYNMRDKWSRGVSVSAVHNLQFVPLVATNDFLLKNISNDTACTDGIKWYEHLLCGSVAKLVSGTIFYPFEVYRTNLRIHTDYNIKTFVYSGWRFWSGGYLAYLVRSVPQTGITLGMFYTLNTI